MNVSLLRTLALTGGEWVVYALLACSVVALAAIIERAMLLVRERRDFDGLRDAVMGQLGEDPAALEKTVKRHAGAAGRILQTALAQAHVGAAGVEDLLTAASLEERTRLEKRLLILG